MSSRLGRRTALTVLFLATLAFAPANVPGDYRIVAHLPDVMDGQALRSPRYDWKSHRLFAGFVASASIRPTSRGPTRR